MRTTSVSASAAEDGASGVGTGVGAGDGAGGAWPRARPAPARAGAAAARARLFANPRREGAGGRIESDICRLRQRFRGGSIYLDSEGHALHTSAAMTNFAATATRTIKTSTRSGRGIASLVLIKRSTRESGRGD